MANDSASLYEFGRFCLDISEHRLLRDQETIPLPPKVLDTLSVLVKHSGHILSKEELMSAVWGETFVDEGSLTRNISLLRKALQENGDKYIETVPKRGYRFIVPVRMVSSTNGSESRLSVPPAIDESVHEIEPLNFKQEELSPPTVNVNKGVRRSSWVLLSLLLLVTIGAGGYFWGARSLKKNQATAAQTEAPPKSLAVLPFKVLGNERGGEFLGLGMADAIIVRLSDCKHCRIRPTTAISKYKDGDFDSLLVGKQLGVDVVLDGTVQHVEDRIRVTVLLLDLKDGNAIWSGKFDEPYGDLLELQDSVSTQVAAQLRLELDTKIFSARTRSTTNVTAYRYYAMGYYFWSKRTRADLAKAIQYFRNAIEEDPNYALAYSSLTDAYLLNSFYGYELVPLQESYDRAKAAAVKAIHLDDTLPEVQIANGMVKEFEGDLSGAESSYRRAIALNPGSTTAHVRYGHLLASTSRLDGAISELRSAHEIDPVSALASSALGAYLLLARQYDESIKYSKLALELDPQAASTRESLAWAYALKGKYDEATAEFMELDRSRSACEHDDTGLAYVAASQGRAKEARQLLAQTEAQVRSGNGLAHTPLQIAMVLCALGEKEEALAWLEWAVETHRLRTYQLEYSAELDPLKSDPRFGEMMSRVRATRPPVNGLRAQAD